MAKPKEPTNTTDTPAAEEEVDLQIEQREVNGELVDWSKALGGPVTEFTMIPEEAAPETPEPTTDPQGTELHPHVAMADAPAETATAS